MLQYIVSICVKHVSVLLTNEIHRSRKT